MTTSLTIERDFHFRRQGRGARKELRVGSAPTRPLVPLGRVPRITRLLALAIRFDRLIRAGEIANYGELAELGHVSRARVSQIMNLLQLSPDIQEQILFLPPIQGGRDRIYLRQLQSIASVFDWRKQQSIWERLLKSSSAEGMST